MPSWSGVQGKGRTVCTLVVATVLATAGIGMVVHRGAITTTVTTADGSGLRPVPADRTLEPGAAAITALPHLSTPLAVPEPPPAPTTTAAPERHSVVDLEDAPDRVDARVSAFGDSVLLEAEPGLAAAVSDLALDAVVGRQAAGTLEAVRASHDSGELRDLAVVQVGNNGPVTNGEFDEIMSLLSGAERVVVLNVKVDRDWEGQNNDLLAAGVERWPNAVLLDWHGLASEDPESLLSDGVHLLPAGARLFTRLILSGL